MSDVWGDGTGSSPPGPPPAPYGGAPPPGAGGSGAQPPAGPPRGPIGPPPSATGPTSPVPPGQSGRSPALWVLAAIGVFLVLALVAGGAFFLVNDAEAEVILEPTAAEGDDPFTESTAAVEVDVEGGGFERVSGGGDEVESVEGAAPGLYGGTGQEAACDATQLVEFLEADEDKAAAWAGVLGIEASEIRDYVAGLTPLVLREDTRVTNHGFSGGRATAFQSVLQAGTAVMVDDQGVPRVRCACGNPLTEPEEASASFEGDGWEAFDPNRLVAVSAGPTVEAFEVVDVESGEPAEVPIGSLAEPTTADQLQDAEVPQTNQCRGGQLVDGAVQGIPPEQGFQEIIDSSVAIGDFTGDGVDDGAFILSCSGGGSGLFEDVVAYSNGATLLGAIPIEQYGDRVLAIRIVDGVLEVDFGIYQDGDSNASGPSGQATGRFVWDGTAFVEPGAEPAEGGGASDLQAFLDETLAPDHAGSCEGLTFDAAAPNAVCTVVLQETEDRAVVNVCFPESECAGAFLYERDDSGAWQQVDDYPYSSELPAPPDYPPPPDWLAEAQAQVEQQAG